MNLSEFAIDFLEGALITVEDEKISQEDAITNDILEYAIDSGEVIAFELCHYKVRGIKINAWNYDEENEAIDLFVSIFKSEQRLTKVSDKDVQDTFTKAENFFWGNTRFHRICVIDVFKRRLSSLASPLSSSPQRYPGPPGCAGASLKSQEDWRRRD